ncbi:flagellar hook protein FlgE [Caulobacter vibrioides]|uniref:Flagellar hook protein FlgE n=3 Tax=Caulobacter vibrioides TaxID=155892 RepID=FLGE_CAUVC|nr:flagellar hook protein FlgE [Caulobacter vibrioides]YP_002516320.1 flagellar hook protein FlgE [Caulobacter vibrioides NA1000]P35806.2 RecName: Full=Flagellar hook protein FlgE [Caulobacter vibrioides CB15]AAC33329.1 flagellar hook protein [Caulobacter vibrioides CB15]AAK22886.1 flagellar hook protein [Caulobacter vibrioides CB15]ACL94412.1 flagellar hook protein FlgE [Caulobacter vibrioides NA1000]ATC27739.1 flagellar hook protein FlgE [Caulobacter vibrioides]QXZ52979.1 flagellar hook pr
MSINSAMLAGVSGLIANSSALAAISDNIANVNTVGFKRSTSNFSTLVTSGNKNQTYSAGGVKAQTHQFISQQGLTQSTTSNLDISISGAGFFVTTEKPENLTATDTRSFTRAGSFQLDNLGYLRNDAGLYLQGWLADPVSGLITPDPSDLMQLASINVGSVGGTAEKTTRVGVNANLRSEQPVAAAVSYKVGTAGSPSKTNVVDSATNSHNYDVVYSSTGIANPVSGNNEYLVDIKENGVIVATGKVAYDAATNELVSSTIDYKGASPVTGSMTTTRINAAGTTVNLADLGIVNASGADDAEVVAGKLYDPSTWSMSDYAKDNSKGVKPDFEVQIPLSDSKGGQRTVTLSMLKGPGPNQWYAELRAKPGDLANNGNGQISTGIIEFTTDGKLKNTGSLFGTTSPTAITIKSSGYIAPTVTPPAVQPPTPPTWADALGIDEQEVQIDLASAAGGLTQYNSQSVVQSVNTNGTAFGNLTNIEIDEGGYVSAIFDNGVTRRIAQVAIATFSNPNGLKGVNGNAYRVTNESGTYSLKAPSQGGAGALAPSTLEASTVDLSQEFTGLITTQRAYSASSKIITTADQMLEELLNIKR